MDSQEPLSAASPTDPAPDLQKTCKRGHEYDWNLKRCPVCVRARNKEWRQANRDICNRINRDSYHRTKQQPEAP